MKNSSIIPLLFALMFTLTAASKTHTPRNHPWVKGPEAPSAPRPADGGQAAQKESPIACNLSALTATERKRLGELGPMLLHLHTGLRELADGYEFQFPSDRKTFGLLSECAY